MMAASNVFVHSFFRSLFLCIHEFIKNVCFIIRYFIFHVIIRLFLKLIDHLFIYFIHSSIRKCYFSFQPVLHDWCNKGRGMCYPVCVMMHIKEPLLLIEKSSPCGSSGFPLSLSEWSFTICLTPYNRK